LSSSKESIYLDISIFSSTTASSCVFLGLFFPGPGSMPSSQDQNPGNGSFPSSYEGWLLFVFLGALYCLGNGADGLGDGCLGDGGLGDGCLGDGGLGDGGLFIFFFFNNSLPNFPVILT